MDTNEAIVKTLEHVELIMSSVARARLMVRCYWRLSVQRR